MVIVLIVSKKALAVTRIYSPNPGVVELRGKVLDPEIGIFAVRISNIEPGKEGKDVKAVGPEKIEYKKPSKEFIATLEGVDLDSSSRPTKFAELFTRTNPENIPYLK